MRAASLVAFHFTADVISALSSQTAGLTPPDGAQVGIRNIRSFDEGTYSGFLSDSSRDKGVVTLATVIAFGVASVLAFLLRPGLARQKSFPDYGSAPSEGQHPSFTEGQYPSFTGDALPEDALFEGAIEPSSPFANSYLLRMRIWSLTSLNFAYGFTFAIQGILVAPLEAERLFPGNASLALGAFVALVGLSQLIGPEAGHWSDIWRSPMGRRRPLILITTVALIGFIFALWLMSLHMLPGAFVVIFSMQHVTWNILYSTQLGLVPDCVPEAHRAFAGGASAASILLGALFAFVCMHFFSSMDYHYYYGFMAIIIFLCCMLACSVAAEQSSMGRPEDDNSGGLFARTKLHYYFDFSNLREFFLLLVTKCLYCAAAVVKGFLFYFCQDTFRLPVPADERALTAKVSICAEATAALAAVIMMPLLDRTLSHGQEDAVQGQLSASEEMRRGNTSRGLWALGIGALWMGVLWHGPLIVGLEVHNTFPEAGEPAAQAWSNFMVAGTAIWGIGQGVYLAGDQALVFLLLPDKDEAARFLGFVSVCACIGASIGGIAAGCLLYAFGGTGASRGQAYGVNGYCAIFIFASALSLVIPILAAQISTQKKKKAQQDA